jgi:hypothetical protein
MDPDPGGPKTRGSGGFGSGFGSGTLLLRLFINLRIEFLVQRKGPEGLTETYPERPSKEDGEEA